jgi:Cys-rich protein (TIGR04453 family)
MVWILLLSFLIYIQFQPISNVPTQKKEFPPSCKTYSKKYLSCIKELQTLDLSALHLRKEEITFLNSCQKNMELIESCFTYETGSCEIIFFCVQKKYIILFGKEKRL